MQQQRLHLVIGMVRYGDKLSLRNLAQKAITRGTSGILQRSSLLMCQSRHIYLANCRGKPPGISQPRDNRGILVARLAAQLVVEMSNMEPHSGVTSIRIASTQPV